MRVALTLPLASALALRVSLAQAPSPTPVPCTFLSQMYPPTKAAFDRSHLSAPERAEVLKWTAKIPKSQSKYARWMRYGSGPDRTLLIFSATPAGTTRRGWYKPWVAVNKNVIINARTCEVTAYPNF
jgi:hypothetical protein